MSALRHAEALLASTRALQSALREDDSAGLESALRARQDAFSELERSAGRGFSQAVRGVVREVRAIDRELAVGLREITERVRSQLGALTTSRRAARGYRGAAAPPRFIAERV